MGNHLYEENKRLKQENENLRAQLKTKATQDLREDVDTLCVHAIQNFLTGKAFLDVMPGPNVEGSHMVFFRNVEHPKQHAMPVGPDCQPGA